MGNILRREHDDELSPAGLIPSASAPAVTPSPVPGGSGTWLSPARVIGVEVERLLVELPDGRRLSARMALAFPYEPALGDELLLLGDDRSAYVTGVLSGRGVTRLHLKGDVKIAAEGSLELSSARSVTLDAPSVEVRAERLHTVAGRVTEVFDSVRKTVRTLFSMRAGEHQTLVEGTSQLVAKNARTLSEGKVTINGKEIFLG
jgi:hypothetical protein